MHVLILARVLHTGGQQAKLPRNDCWHLFGQDNLSKASYLTKICNWNSCLLWYVSVIIGNSSENSWCIANLAMLQKHLFYHHLMWSAGSCRIWKHICYDLAEQPWSPLDKRLSSAFWSTFLSILMWTGFLLALNHSLFGLYSSHAVLTWQNQHGPEGNSQLPFCSWKACNFYHRLLLVYYLKVQLLQ